MNVDPTVCNADHADQLSPIQCNQFKNIGLCNSSNGDLQDFMAENCFVTCGNCQGKLKKG